MKRFVMIVGAGASVPYFEPILTTDSLTAALVDAAKWSDLLNRYDSHAQGANSIQPAAVNGLLGRMRQALPDGNFEDYIEIIDRIASYGLDATSAKIQSATIRLLNGCLPICPMHTWTAVPFLARQLLFEHISLKHSSETSSGYPSLVRSLSSLLGYLAAQGPLSVACFNYDDVLPEAVQSATVPLSDGFEGGPFDPGKYLAAPHVVAYMHGQARFVAGQKSTCMCASIDEANRERFQRLYSHTGDEAAYVREAATSYTFNTSMVTGRDKDSAFDANPYSAYYQRLASDLRTADRVIVIGFSFGDRHIVRLLMNFLRLNPANRLLVVDYHPSPVEMMASFTNTGSLLHRALSAFDIDSLPLHGNFAQHTYANQSGIDDLNRTGCAEIYPRLVFYKEGFASFLGEYAAALSLLGI